MQGLAAAYISLQSQQFLGSSIPHFRLHAASENIRNTSELELDADQPAPVAVEHHLQRRTLRGRWDQIYTFKAIKRAPMQRRQRLPEARLTE